MTREKAQELHKRFLPGISGQMLLLCAAGLISATFFVRGQYDSLMQYQIATRAHGDSLTVATSGRIERKFDIRTDTLQNEIKELRLFVLHKFEIQSINGSSKFAKPVFVTEHKDRNGNLTVQQYNPTE